MDPCPSEWLLSAICLQTAQPRECELKRVRLSSIRRRLGLQSSGARALGVLGMLSGSGVCWGVLDMLSGSGTCWACGHCLLLGQGTRAAGLLWPAAVKQFHVPAWVVHIAASRNAITYCTCRL